MRLPLFGKSENSLFFKLNSTPTSLHAYANYTSSKTVNAHFNLVTRRANNRHIRHRILQFNFDQQMRTDMERSLFLVFFFRQFNSPTTNIF